MNPSVAKALVIAAAVFVIFAAISGCEWGDMVRVDTPKNVQESRALPAKMPVNDAVYEYEDWLAATERDGRRWQAEIESASQIVAFLNTFSLRAIGELGPAVAGVPVLSALVPALVGLGGLLVRRPGDVSATDAKRQSDQNWDEAFQAGKQAVMDGIRST